MNLRTVNIYSSGVRSLLFLGCDRELIMLTAILACALVFMAMTITATIWGTVMWLFSLWVLRLAAKKDALMRHIYIRSLRYKKYHAARATVFGVELKHL